MKKIITVIISIIIGILITLLGISFSLKKIIITTFTNAYTSDGISNRIMVVLRSNLNDLTDYQFNEIEQKLNSSKEFVEISNKYLDAIMNDILQGTTSKVDISNEVNNIVDNSFQGLNPEVTKVLKDKIMNINYDNIYDQVLYNVTKNQHLNDDYKVYINVYKTFISSNTKLILICSTIFCMLLVCLVNMSVLKILNIGSTSLLISSLILFITNLIIYKFVPPLTYRLVGKPIDVYSQPLIILNVVYFASGLILGKLYDIILKYCKK